MRAALLLTAAGASATAPPETLVPLDKLLDGQALDYNTLSLLSNFSVSFLGSFPLQMLNAPVRGLHVDSVAVTRESGEQSMSVGITAEGAGFDFRTMYSFANVYDPDAPPTVGTLNLSAPHNDARISAKIRLTGAAPFSRAVPSNATLESCDISLGRFNVSSDGGLDYLFSHENMVSEVGLACSQILPDLIDRVTGDAVDQWIARQAATCGSGAPPGPTPAPTGSRIAKSGADGPLTIPIVYAMLFGLSGVVFAVLMTMAPGLGCSGRPAGRSGARDTRRCAALALLATLCPLPVQCRDVGDLPSQVRVGMAVSQRFINAFNKYASFDQRIEQEKSRVRKTQQQVTYATVQFDEAEAKLTQASFRNARPQLIATLSSAVNTQTEQLQEAYEISQSASNNAQELIHGWKQARHVRKQLAEAYAEQRKAEEEGSQEGGEELSQKIASLLEKLMEFGLVSQKYKAQQELLKYKFPDPCQADQNSGSEECQTKETYTHAQNFIDVLDQSKADSELYKLVDGPNEGSSIHIGRTNTKTNKQDSRKVDHHAEYSNSVKFDVKSGMGLGPSVNGQTSISVAEQGSHGSSTDTLHAGEEGEVDIRFYFRMTRQLKHFDALSGDKLIDGWNSMFPHSDTFASRSAEYLYSCARGEHQDCQDSRQQHSNRLYIISGTGHFARMTANVRIRSIETSDESKNSLATELSHATSIGGSAGLAFIASKKGDAATSFSAGGGAAWQNLQSQFQFTNVADIEFQGIAAPLSSESYSVVLKMLEQTQKMGTEKAEEDRKRVEKDEKNRKEQEGQGKTGDPNAAMRRAIARQNAVNERVAAMKATVESVLQASAIKEHPMTAITVNAMMVMADVFQNSCIEQNEKAKEDATEGGTRAAGDVFTFETFPLTKQAVAKVAVKQKVWKLHPEDDDESDKGDDKDEDEE